MRDKLKELEPDISPLTALLTKMPLRAATASPPWLVDELIPRISTLDKLAASSNLLKVSDPRFYKENDVLRVVATGENVVVTKVTPEGLVVKRNIGSVVATDIWTPTEIITIGNASPQGGQVIARNPNPFMNNQYPVVMHDYPNPEPLVRSGVPSSYAEWDLSIRQGNYFYGRFTREEITTFGESVKLSYDCSMVNSFFKGVMGYS